MGMEWNAESGNACRLFGLLGRRLGHSYSKAYFGKKFALLGQTGCRYELFESERIADFMHRIGEMNSLSGFNVTIPYKTAVLPYLDSLDESAQCVGAVNVVKIFRNQSGAIIRLKGYNTDCPAFRATLERAGGMAYTDALVLGTGGASKAVGATLRTMGIRHTFVSRAPAPGQLGYYDLDADVMSRCRLIVNTTPLGMWPDTESAPPLPYPLIGSGHLCYDLVYNPAETLFMRKATENGARAVGGLPMLELQADMSWDIWSND